jgi:Ca2+-binding RTX toxin-like protein
MTYQVKVSLNDDQIVRVWELEDGSEELESFDEDEAWEYVDNQLTKREIDDGVLEIYYFGGPDYETESGDLVFSLDRKVEFVLDPNYVPEGDRYRVELDSTGGLLRLWEWDDGDWEVEDINGDDENWTYSDGKLIKVEREYGLLETEIYTEDPGNPGQYTLYKKTESGGSYGDTLYGGACIDVMKGLGGRDKIFGYKGNDRLYGGESSDLMCGGAGSDYISGGQGVDTARFSSNNNQIDLRITSRQNTGEGRDRLISIENIDAGGGKDLIIGNGGANKLNGGRGADRIKGKGGRDLLIGGGGIDQLWGEGGKDTFRVVKGTGYCIIKDFVDGVDRIQLGSGTSGIKINNRNGDAFVYQDGDLIARVDDAARDLQRSGSYLV